MTGARPSVGSSSSRSRAPVRRMRPIASICCSPPDSFVPWLFSRSRTLGNSAKMRSRSRPPGRTCGGSNKFSLTSRLEKIPPLLGAEGDAGAGDHVGGKLGQLAVLEAHRAGAVLDDAHDRLERRGFADAVAAEQRHHLAGLHVEGRAVKHVGLAVPGFEIVDGKERARLSHALFQDDLSQDDWYQDGRSRDRLRAPPDPPTPS